MSIRNTQETRASMEMAEEIDGEKSGGSGEYNREVIIGGIA